jgi:hypothetical protein
MPVLDNARHERFAQFVAEGKTLDEAYQRAGYKPSRFNASHLADRQDVKCRIQQLTTELAEASNITKEKLVKMALDLHKASADNHQYSAAGAMIKELGVLTGHRIERSEVGSPGEFEAMQDGELWDALQARFAVMTAARTDETTH